MSEPVLVCTVDEWQCEYWFWHRTVDGKNYSSQTFNTAAAARRAKMLGKLIWEEE